MELDLGWVSLRRSMLVAVLVAVSSGFVLNLAELLQAAQDNDAPASASVLPWQRLDQYVPPDFYGHFPDDRKAGHRLDELYDQWQRGAPIGTEAIHQVRQGLRRTRRHRTLILRLIGNHFIWNKDPQDPQAVDLMYHAFDHRAGGEHMHYAMYFGLSVTRPKTTNVLRALVEGAIHSNWNFDVGRIRWGCQGQMQDLLAAVRQVESSVDPAEAEAARMFARYLTEDFDFRGWKRQRQVEKARQKYADDLVQIREQLLRGDSTGRRAAQQRVLRELDLLLAMDEAVLEAWEAAARDPDATVRAEVARLVGSGWVWGQPVQSQRAIDLEIILTADPHRDVRYNAVYHALSVVDDKTEAVIAAMLHAGLQEGAWDSNLHGRITWALAEPRHNQQAISLLDQMLRHTPKQAPLRDAQRAIARRLYSELAGHDHPLPDDVETSTHRAASASDADLPPPAFKGSLVCFIGKDRAGSSCRTTMAKVEHGLRVVSGKLNCGYQGAVSEISWTYRGNKDGKDLYHLTRRFPVDSANPKTTVTDVAFDGERQVIFEDAAHCVVIELHLTE